MYPREFEYYDAASIEEVFEHRADHEDEMVELLAGGHSLIPMMKSGLATPDVLIDISDIDDLHGIQRGEDETRIGALTTYSTALETEGLAEDAPAFAEAVGEIGDMQVKSRGTVGGNLAHADPASDLTGAALASDVTLTAVGPNGERTIDVDEFYHGMYATALEEDELLTAVTVPHVGEKTAGAYVKKPHPGSGYAVIGVAALVTVEDGTVDSARLAANGITDRAVRLSAVEEALADQGTTDDRFDAAAERAGETIDDIELMDDSYASGEFRRTLLREYTGQALRIAHDRLD